MVVSKESGVHFSWDCHQIPQLPQICSYPSASALIPSKGPTLAVMVTKGLGPAWKSKDMGEGLKRRQVEGGTERMRQCLGSRAG